MRKNEFIIGIGELYEPGYVEIDIPWRRETRERIKRYVSYFGLECIVSFSEWENHSITPKNEYLTSIEVEIKLIPKEGDRRTAKQLKEIVMKAFESESDGHRLSVTFNDGDSRKTASWQRNWRTERRLEKDLEMERTRESWYYY